MHPSVIPDRTHRDWSPARKARVAAVVLWLAMSALPVAAGQVYRWVDEEGITHLSSEKPPPGVDAERINVARSSSSPAGSGTRGGTASRTGTSVPSPEQLARRAELLGSLRTRECVIALEALDRKGSGGEATSAEEIRRLRQTTDLNCSPDPAGRRRQEEMAARLRVANGPACVEARDRLADMLEADARVPREQLRAQQQFVDEHCIPPVR